MSGVLKNELKKLFARPEIAVAVVLLCLLPLALGALLTSWASPDLSKYENLPENHYSNRIYACQRSLEEASATENEIATIKDEIKLCEVLREKEIFSTSCWQYTLTQLALSSGAPENFTEAACQAIRTDDYNYFYDKMILLSSGPRQELYRKLKALDVYPSFTDYRYLLALRVSEAADTPEDRLLIFRIENGIPEKPLEGSYSGFAGKIPAILILLSVVYSSFVASYVFAADRKNKVPHPSAVLPGAGKLIAAKILLLVFVLPLTVLASFAVALAAGRLIFEGSLPRDVFVNASGGMRVKPFSEIVTDQWLKLLLTTGVSGAVAGLLSYIFRNEIAGFAAGGVLALLSLILIF
ncbi:MAG: hypothetical protein J5912_04055 [Clostridia bacterium]|nr:hypothetical protein [Clostridia bacterium]